MQRRGLVALFGIVFVSLLLPVAPATFLSAHSSTSVPSAGSAREFVGPAPMLATHAVVAPYAGYHRVIMVETFTGVWCPHCPAETQALHYIDEANNSSVIAISELHACAFPTGSGPCLDNYVPADGTSTVRGTFYNVCGYPDVFFDGNYPSCGATNSATQMQGIYDRALANASMYPGNVSIAQSSVVTATSVVDNVNITSAITGSYNVVTYLVEYIGLLNISNGGGPHDIDHVVRSTLMNHPVSLTAGATTSVRAVGALNSTWNIHNFSVVTLVQQNSTKIIQNANMAPVSMLTTAVNANVTAAISGTQSTITVKVDNSSNGMPLAGATVNLTVQGGGSLSSSTGVTASDGTFVATYTAPKVAVATQVNITADVSAVNYTSAPTTFGLIVNPWVLPLVPNTLSVTPGNQEVPLSWTAPSSGGVGLTYWIYRGTSAAGPFAEVGATTATAFLDTSVASGQSYWYTVAAQNAGGFSPNTTAVAATQVTATPQGLPPSVGWWLAFGAVNFTVAESNVLSLYFPSGAAGYTYGPGSYAFVASTASGTISPSGHSLSITLVFIPRYASLQGTVTPASATVTIAGSVVPVVDGSFSDLLAAGTYALNVSASGYTTNSTNVTLTPGNLTTDNVALQPVSSGGSQSPGASSGGLSNSQVLLVLVAVAAAAVIIVVAAAMSSRGKRGRGRRPVRRAPPAEEPAPETEA